MTSLDVLYYTLTIGTVVFVGAVWYIAFHVVDTLQTAKPILQDMKQITHDVEELKNTVKTLFPLGIIGRVVGFGMNKIFKKHG